MLGRRRRHLARFPTADSFFEARTNRKLWSGRRLSELLLERGAFDLADPPDYMRVLLVWKATFVATRSAGQTELGDRYLLLRHEDLGDDPVTTLTRLYD